MCEREGRADRIEDTAIGAQSVLGGGENVTSTVKMLRGED